MADTNTKPLPAQVLHDSWPILVPSERIEGFRLLAREEAEDFFHSLTTYGQSTLIQEMDSVERRIWVRLLAPDDIADLLQEDLPEETKTQIQSFLDPSVRSEVNALLAYAEDDAGGLMSPRFARVRPDMRVDEAITYIRRQAPHIETMYYLYALDHDQRLKGLMSFRELFLTSGDKKISEVMIAEDYLTVLEDTDQEEVAHLLARHDLMAIPVVDEQHRMKGIITHDDIVDVFKEEATEDMQKMGGMEALVAPYLQTNFFTLVKKRAVWLGVLFLGQLITATVMRRYLPQSQGVNSNEQAIWTMLSVFIPLIIANGGNSGSQTATLVIRAMALSEVKLKDWRHVLRREFFSGIVLGAILATLGVCNVFATEFLFHPFGPDQVGLVALTVGVSLVGVVLCGTVSGSMLPFIMRRLGADPASASNPFVATLCDVSGLLIYFTTAQIVFVHLLTK